jgi:hypothetical protein
LRRETYDIPLGAILLLATVVRFWGIGFGLPHTWARPDEHAVMVPAVHAVQGEFNPHWFHYPSLYMYVLAPLYGAYYVEQRLRGGIASRADLYNLYLTFPDSFHLLNRWLVATLGVLTVFVLYRTARLFFSETAACSAALFLAVVPLHVRDSHFGVADVPATFMIVLSLYAIAVWANAPSVRRLVVAGVSCGLAASTKYNAALVVIPAIVALLSRSTRGFSRLLKNASLQGTRPKAQAIVRDLGVLLSCAGLAFVAGTPYALLDYQEFVSGVREVGQHLGAGHGLDLGIGWIYHLRATLRYGLGLPLLVASLIGMAWMFVERPRTASLLFSFPIAYYIVAGGTRTVFFRYMIPIVPFLCLAAGYTVERVSTIVGRRMPTANSTIPPALVGLLIGVAAIDVVRLDLLLQRTDSRVLAAEWLLTHYSPATTVYQTGAFYGHLEYGRSPRFREATFPGGTFMLNGTPMTSPPDLLVVQSSPLMYSAEAPVISEMAAREYERVAEFRAHDPARTASHVYDPIDAFYLPLRGFDGVERPGPNVTIYARR